MKNQRSCIACRKKDDKSIFIKIIKNKNGDILIDTNNNLEGRGAYICNSIECLEKAIKENKLERAFKCKLDRNIYEKLRGVIIGK